MSRAWVAVAILLSAGVTGCGSVPGRAMAASMPAAEAGGGTLIVLVRHAEAETDPGGDPVLTAAGLARSARLAGLLRDTGVDTIHTTDTRRTRATAAPIASLLGLEPIVYDGRRLDVFAGRLLATRGRHLVVGHSNTTPQLVRLLGGEAGPDIVHTEHDRVYLIILDGQGRDPRTVLLRY